MERGMTDWTSGVRAELGMVLEAIRDQQSAGSGKVKFYTAVAVQLSRAVDKRPDWTWRYVQGVEKGSIEASALFARAVRALGAGLDGTPAAAVDVVQVKVLARPGRVKEGSVVLGESRMCERPGCRVWFVPNVPWRRFCSEECGKKARKHL